MSVKEKDGVLEVLTGEGVNSDNKIVRWILLIQGCKSP